MVHNQKFLLETINHYRFIVLKKFLLIKLKSLQEKLKKSGQPWEKAKSFDNSAVVGDWIDVSNFQDINNINFCLKLNNEIVQSSNSSNMIRKIDDLIT